MKKFLINTKGRDLLWFSLATLLILSITGMTTIVPVDALPGEPKMFVDPPEIVTNATFHPAGTNFTVEVRIANVTGLVGVEFQLWWDSALLSGVSMEDVLFTENTPPGNESNIWKIKHVVTSDHVEYGYTYMDLPAGIDNGYLPINITDGSQIVARIKLQVEDEPTKSEGFLETLLDLKEDVLGDMDAIEIAHTTEDGYFKLDWTPPTTKPYLSVEPDSYVASHLNETFDINITINNLEEGWELIELEFKLGFNGTLLEALAVDNGTFFESFAGPPNGGVLYTNVVEFDYVHVDAQVLPDENGTWHKPYPNGGGVVVTIQLKANSSQVASSGLDLFDILGSDTNAVEVPFDPAQNGSYLFDNIPPSIGTPSQEPSADNVMANEEVTVSVNVTDVDSDVREVILSYTLNNGTSWDNVTMSYSSTTSLYEGIIPGQSLDTTVKYKIIAYDNANNSAAEDNAGEYYPYLVIPEFSTWLSLFVTIFLITIAAILVKRKLKPHRLSVAKQTREA